MKINFKKITALAGSLLMTGATMGLAAAAAYPAPFVSNGSANTAVVYGAGAASTDLTASANVQVDLQSYEDMTGDTSVVGGDSVKFEKSSTKWHLGNGLLEIDSTDVVDDDMPSLLADGKFLDDDNDEFDFSQKVEMNNLTLQMFEDNDYKADEPTVGIKISNGANILNYTLDFTDEPLWSDLETTDLTLMGKTYYILDTSSNTTLTLLDSADDTILAEGETATVSGKEVSINFISTSEVILTVDGVNTNSLSEGETQKLTDGTYVGVKDILFDSKDTGISKVEFSIGNGKLILQNNTDVELNEESISDLGVTITNSGTDATTKLSKVVLQWDADDDLFVTEDSDVTMPGFETLKLSFGGMVYPLTEEIMVEADGDNSYMLNDFPLERSTEDINLLYTNGTHMKYIGKDSDEILRTGTSSITFDGDTDSYFVASWSDGNDAESHLMKATNWKNQSGKQYVTFQYKKDGVWTDAKTDAELTDTFTLGNVELTVGEVYDDNKTATVTVSNSNTMNFNTLYSKEGLKLYLPYNTTAAGRGAVNLTNNMSAAGGMWPTSFTLIAEEEDKDGNIASGKTVNLTLSHNTVSEASIETVTGSVSGTGSDSRIEIEDTDVYRSFTYSPLATEVLEDESGDQESVTLNYHGGESYGEVYLTSSEATVTGDGSSGVMYVKDTEVGSVATKNLIVVGGSCINSAAADLVGGAYCGASWTEATGVGSGQFLIKGYADSTITSKMALLVAGYDAADTVNAATYLRNEKPDTSSEYLGTSATSAELVVE